LEHFDGNSTLHLNKFHLEHINYLIRKAEKKGIHLIFFLSPRIRPGGELNDQIGLFEAIDSRHKLSIADPVRYPKLYLVQYSYSLIYMNSDGVKLYTKALADEFKKLVISL
jgi:hypothetical protein